MHAAAEKSAERMLQDVWKGRGFPIDPVTISLQLGIQVKQATLPEDVSGAIIKKKGSDPVILLEETDSDNRKRFTCAHELGHFVYRMETRPEAEEYEWVDFRDLESSMGIIEEERYANGFAASLLMPRDAVVRQWRDSRFLPSLAYYFGVSVEAAVNRLKNLGLLTP